MVTLKVEDALISLYVAVTDNLTTEGILGIDFLRHNRCIIDLYSNTLKLANGKAIQMLHRESIKRDVRLVAPLRSEIDVTGNCHSLPSSLWLLEGQPLSPPQTVIAARAVLKSSTDLPLTQYMQGSSRSSSTKEQSWESGRIRFLSLVSNL